MSLPVFLQDILDDGCATIEGVAAVTDDDRAAAAEILTEFERRCRIDFPGDPPAFSQPAAVWAAEMLFNACRCLLFRAIDEAGIEELLSQPFPGECDASAHWSVDLSFALLPDLIARARSASPDDPLLKILKRWANDWPLSSVGVADVEPADVDAVVSHQGLLRLYCDRIVARKDFTRLTHATVYREIEYSLGAHPELAPEFNRRLQTVEEEQPE